MGDTVVAAAAAGCAYFSCCLYVLQSSGFLALQFVHSGRSNPQRMTPNNPVDAGGLRWWLRRWDGDGDDDDGGGADVGGNLGPTMTTKMTVASAVVVAPGGGEGGDDVPTTMPTAADGAGGGRLPARMSRHHRNRKWTRSSLAGGTWRRSRVTTVPGGPPLDHLW